MSEWQEYLWEEALQVLKYNLLDNVYLNDVPITPQNTEQVYVVYFRTIRKNEYIDKGYLVFKSAAALRVSLSRWIEEQNFISSVRENESGCISVSYPCTQLSDIGVLIIKKQYQDEEGLLHLAPWPESQRATIAKAITTYKTNSSAIPIGIGESAEDIEIPYMSPKVMTNKSFELPEINFNLEN
jgi:hypothetical protein